MQRRFAAGPESHAPAILLAKMGLDLECGGFGYGKVLVRSAIETAVQASDKVACRLLVVDAKTDQLVDFYSKLGFQKLEVDKRRLIMKMSRARELLDL